MSISALVGAAVVLIASAAMWISGRRADRARQRRFDERADLRVIEGWEQFCRVNGVPLIAAEEALHFIENATSIPKTKLKPDDQFSEELAPVSGWEFDDGLLELQWVLEAAGVDRTEVQTVGDFVKRFAAKRGERGVL